MSNFDPRTKLALGIMAIAAVLITREEVTLIAEFVIVLIAIPLVGPGRKLLRSVRLVWSMLILVFIIGLIFGRRFLKINPVLLFGALTGSGTVITALYALKESSDSSAPTLGYAVPYAFGNVILTVWGTVIIHLIR